MSILTLNILCWVALLFLVNSSESLKCRSGNRRSNDHVHKVMQTCYKKYSSNGNKNGNDYTSSSEGNSSDEDSASSASLDEEIFFGKSNKRSGENRSRNANNGQWSSGNYGENRRNDGRKPDTYNRMSNSKNYSWVNGGGHDMSNQNENRNYQSGTTSHSQNRGKTNNDQQNRNECATQCFFEELNSVDQRGFPERGSVMEIMTRGIQDPSLRDFIEESITECFHYLESDMNNREKCTFSYNLMNCFADKARDRCEDWDDQ